MASISGISSLDPSNQSTSSTDPRKAVRQLFSAIENGDLQAAQQAYNTLSQNNPAGPISKSVIGQDFSAIGDALKSGDVSGAQQALDTLKTDLQAAAKTHKHHHGHHHHGAKAAASTDASSTTSTPDANDPTSLVGTTLSVKA